MSMFTDGLDRRRLMNHGRIVEQQQRPWLGQGKAFAIGAVRLEDARLAALDLFAPDQQYGDEIDAVAVCAFRRGPADAIGRIDAELVRFCLLYTSPSPRDQRGSRMPSSA